MLRILLGDPWDDYDYVYSLRQDMVAKRKVPYFKLVNIRQCHSSDAIEQSRLLSRIQSPNIATVYALYCDGNNISIVTEYLGIHLSQLELQKYHLEEWEMATIIAEVLKGIAYISSLKLSCRNISGANIRLSLDGEIKLGKFIFTF
ncbi:kinase-like domain-containing protein [Halenospora varia]|nr:kinase-like domain-containing protein [Halenospora varia]